MVQTSVSPLIQAYMRFLQLSQVLDGSSPQPQLDANEKVLLEALAVRWHAGEPMTVMQAMGLKDLGSPATMHRRIARLRKIGLIETFEDPEDTRIKRLALTSTALGYFENLGAQVQRATDQ
jgi:DNA-binding MarR family transcriptional regulator